MFNVRRGEGRPLLLLTGYAFAASAAYVLFSTAAYALFLAEFSADRLPLIYIVSAVAVSLFGGLYAWLEGRLPLVRLISSTLVVLLVITGAVLGAVAFLGARWLTFAVVIWSDVAFTLACLGYWALAGRLFDIRQGKRLFGLITAGELAAGAAGGLSVPLVLRFVQTPVLLWLGAAGLVLCLFFLRAVVRSARAELSAGDEDESGGEEVVSAKATEGGYRSLFRGRYVLLIVGFQTAWILAYYFLDFTFYDQAENRYPDADELASFLGLFNGISQGLELAFTVTLSGALIGRYGLKLGLTLPTLVMTVAMIVLGVALGAPGGLFFWMLIATKLLYGLFSSSLLNPASRLLYQPLAPDRRVSLQTFVESILTPLGGGLAGAVLLLVGSGDGTLPRLIVIMLVIWALWALVSMILQREYSAALLSALNNRTLEGEELSFTDANSVAVLRTKLQSPRVAEVLYALALLERIEDDALPALLLEALEHPAAEVRREALETIERLRLTDAALRIRRLIEEDPAPRVRATAIGTFCELGYFDDVDEVTPFLDAEDPEVALGTIVGLLRGGGIEGVLVAGNRVLEMQNASDPAQRVRAARVLGEIAARGFYRPVLKLLEDGDAEVRGAAVQAAGEIRHPRLWPPVTACLARRENRRQAARAIIAGGAEAVPALAESLDLPTATRDLKRLLLRLCGRIDAAASVSLLRRHLEDADGDLRLEVLKALRRVAYAATPEDKPGVDAAVERELDEAGRLQSALQDVADEASPLSGALRLELADAVDRTLLQLALILDAEVIQNARENLSHASKERQAYAVELLDTALANEIKTALLPLLGDHEQGRSKSAAPDEAIERLEWLSSEARKPWTRACALAYAGRERVTALEPVVRAALADDEAVVRESALWTLGELGSADLEQRSRSMADDESPQVRQLAARLLGLEEANMAKLLTLERVVFLKAVGIFAEIPEDVLVSVAAVATEAERKAGEPIFAKGDLGRNLYVIVKGRVRIHDGERLVVVLGEGEVFGEMAVLEAEPRSLSATVEDDVLLLVLGREQFQELMDDYTSITQGVVSMLCRRLRERTSEQER